MKKFKYFFCLLLIINHINCGQTTELSKPLKELVNKNSNTTNVSKYLNEEKWNDLFPNRYGIGLKDSINTNPDFYSFNTFVLVAKIFPSFLSEGDENAQTRELAAFLANIAQETSGGWQNAHEGYFKWGLYFLEEGNPGRTNIYNDTSKKTIQEWRANITMVEDLNN